MKKLFVVSMFVFLAACGKKAGSGSAADKFLADYTAIKDKLCACTDKECATKAKAEADAHEKSDAGKKLTKEDEKKIGEAFEKVEDQINECAAKNGVE